MFFNPEPEHPRSASTPCEMVAESRLPRSVRRPQRRACRRVRRHTSHTVRLLTTQYGYSDYDALNLSVEKRYSNNFSLRGATRSATRAASPPARATRPSCRSAPISSSTSTKRRRDETAAQLHDERPRGNSEDPRRHVERHAARDERRRGSRSRTTHSTPTGTASTSSRCRQAPTIPSARPVST